MGSGRRDLWPPRTTLTLCKPEPKLLTPMSDPSVHQRDHLDTRCAGTQKIVDVVQRWFSYITLPGPPSTGTALSECDPSDDLFSDRSFMVKDVRWHMWVCSGGTEGLTVVPAGHNIVIETSIHSCFCFDVPFRECRYHPPPPKKVFRSPDV